MYIFLFFHVLELLFFYMINHYKLHRKKNAVQKCQHPCRLPADQINGAVNQFLVKLEGAGFNFDRIKNMWDAHGKDPEIFISRVGLFVFIFGGFFPLRVGDFLCFIYLWCRFYFLFNSNNHCELSTCLHKFKLLLSI